MCQVLIAEDEYLEREVLKKIINQSDHAKVIAETNCGQKAITLFKAIKPQLIFINQNMGGISGIETIKKIRQIDSEVAIVLTTSFDDLDEKKHRQIVLLNVSEYLLKPIKPKIIENIVEKYSANKKQSKNSPPHKKMLPFYPTHLLSKEVANTMKYIDANYTKNFSLKDLAGQVYLSEHYLSRLFKKEIGVSLSSYINHKKIEQAKVFLTNTDLSIIKIANLLCFREHNYFCKVFKKIVKKTPSEYRKDMYEFQSERTSVVKKYLP